MKKTREQIKEAMSGSNMHERVNKGVAALAAKLGIPVYFDKEFILMATIPDYYFPTINQSIFLDGSVHKGKQKERDEELRDALARIKKVDVNTIAYANDTDQEYQRIMKEISIILGIE